MNEVFNCYKCLKVGNKLKQKLLNDLNLKKNIFLILLFVVTSCKDKNESSLVLNVDPLIESYKKNNVEYYLRIVSGKDTIYTVDSVCVNKKGMITLEKVKRGWFSETRNKYDSLNRIIQSEHHSDIHYKSKIVYGFDEKHNNLISYIFSNNGMSKSFDKSPNGIIYYEFENNRLSKEIFIDIQSKDTITLNQYKYNSKNKISKILKKNLLDNYEVKIEYKYRKNNTLSEIIGESEIKYISKKTGLIDSVKQTDSNERITYNYYFRK